MLEHDWTCCNQDDSNLSTEEILANPPEQVDLVDWTLIV